jgi:hypothetical protein
MPSSATLDLPNVGTQFIAPSCTQYHPTPVRQLNRDRLHRKQHVPCPECPRPGKQKKEPQNHTDSNIPITPTLFRRQKTIQLNVPTKQPPFPTNETAEKLSCPMSRSKRAYIHRISESNIPNLLQMSQRPEATGQIYLPKRKIKIQCPKMQCPQCPRVHASRNCSIVTNSVSLHQSHKYPLTINESLSTKQSYVYSEGPRTC